MIRVGITGGIGSGKSTFSRIFEKMGIPVFYSDDEGKKLACEDDQLIERIKEAFGEDVYEGRQLRFKKVAAIVFNDKEAMKKLNTIMHPAVNQKFIEWSMKMHNHSYVIEESAVLFESGAERALDFVIGVKASEETRISRVMKRNEMNREDVIARMNNQLPEEEKLEKCDFVIYNEGTESEIWLQRQAQRMNRILIAESIANEKLNELASLHVRKIADCVESRFFRQISDAWKAGHAARPKIKRIILEEIMNIENKLEIASKKSGNSMKSYADYGKIETLEMLLDHHA